ncbi:MAG: hypothetical protein KAR06_01670, partial [Deltaproteobacteria bacterium]|nr:hypothetical protein [Deltaproteobacteria bacterium]
NLARVEGHLDSAKESDYTDDLKNWESGQEKKSEELCLEAERIGLEISKKSGTLAGVEKLIPEAQADLDKVNIKIDDADARVKNLNKKGAEYRDLQVEASTKLKLVEKELTKFEDVEKNCPYCLQEVSESYLANTTEGLFAKQAKLAQKKAEYIEKESDIAEKIDAVDKETPASSANPFINKLSDLNNEKRILDRDIDRMTDDFHVVEQNLEKLHDEKNPYATLQEIRDDKVKTLSAQQEEIAANITAMNKDYELNKYWIKGFKEVRLFVLSEVLQEFEIQVNNALQKLGLPDWTIKLAVDSETKSGTVRKGFSVLVKSPMNDDLVPFECWSGGEGQRLKLAGTLGLMDLIASRAGADWNIEIFDEPTAWLSEEGINDLLDVLKDRSKSTGREIFVIDHRNFNTFGGFDGSINVTKDASGTSLEVEVFGEKT